MEPSSLKESVMAGLAKAYSEGIRICSIKSIEGAINPSGHRNSIHDPEIIAMFKEIEAEGIIRIVGEDEVYFEILREPDLTRSLK